MAPYWLAMVMTTSLVVGLVGGGCAFRLDSAVLDFANHTQLCPRSSLVTANVQSESTTLAQVQSPQLQS